MAPIPLSQNLYGLARLLLQVLQQDLGAYLTEHAALLDNGLELEAPVAQEVQLNDEFFAPPQVFPALRLVHDGSRVHKQLGNQGRVRLAHRFKVQLYLATQRKMVPDADLANTDVQTALGLESAATAACVAACLLEKLPGQLGVVSAEIESITLFQPEQAHQFGVVQQTEIVCVFVQTVRHQHGPAT